MTGIEEHAHTAGEELRGWRPSEPSPGSPAAVAARTVHRRRVRRLAAGVAATVLAVGLVSWQWPDGRDRVDIGPPAGRDDRDRPPRREPSSSTTATTDARANGSSVQGAQATLPPGPDATIPVEPRGEVTSLVPAEGSVWVTALNNETAASVHRIDPATHEIVATIPVESVPGWDVGGGGITAGHGAIWVTGPRSTGGGRETILQRIDPATNAVTDVISLGGTGDADVVADEDAVWVSIFLTDQTVGVVRVDPSTLEVVATIPIEGGWIREILSVDRAVVVRSAVTKGSVVSDTILNVIDPSSNQVTTSRRIPQAQGPFIWSNDVIWSGGPGKTLLRIDPRTVRPVGDPIRLQTAISYTSLAAGDGGLWFVGYDPDDETVPATLNRYSPTTGDVDAKLDPPEGPRALAVGGGSIWTLNDDGSISRMNPR